MDLGLAGKVAVVGGSSRGLGRAIATALASEGARVAICARGREALEATAADIRAETGIEVLPAVCDMSRYDDIRRLITHTVETFGRLDIVVNNAGGPPLGTFEEHPEEAWQAALEQNLLSVVRTVREALPHLRRAGGGRIVNITSVAVKEPVDRLILSNSARLGVVGLAKTLSKELGPDNILVNNVCPGFTLTDRLREVWGARARAEGRPVDEVIEEEAQRIPVRRVGQPEDVAALVVFLASGPARQITGTTIQVDGGSTAAVM
jgi:3-oxoacyl-[acyl-carrier protein] reductase